MGRRFEPIAERHLNITLRGAAEFMCVCPFHADRGASLQFNVEKGLWLCFGCGEKGTAQKLVQKLGGVYADPGVPIEELRKTIKRIQAPEPDPEPPMSESVLRRFGGPIHEYWIERGFKEQTCRDFELGYDPITDRCTIPYRDYQGSLRGIIYRRLGAGFPRYFMPKHFPRTRSLFGAHKIAESRATHVTIVEGSTDVIRLHQAGVRAVAQFGSSIHPDQVQLLRRLGVQSCTLFYDCDEGGRLAEESAAEHLRGLLVYKVVWNPKKYCYTEKVCGCNLREQAQGLPAKHSWREISQCKKRKKCRCGRKHKADPGGLSSRKIREMTTSTVIVGRPTSKKFARRRDAPRRQQGD